jgi:hypothetical protein
MWILFILNTVYGEEETKVTYRNSFQTEQLCHVEGAVLTATFINNEKIICVKR